MSKRISGSCLCGKVKCTVQGPFQRFYQCYCSRCQKRTGSAFASLMFTTPDKIEWLSGKELTKRYDLPEAERFSTCFVPNAVHPFHTSAEIKASLLFQQGLLRVIQKLNLQPTYSGTKGHVGMMKASLQKNMKVT